MLNETLFNRFSSKKVTEKIQYGTHVPWEILAVPYLMKIKGLSSLIFPEFQPLINTVPYKRSL